MQIEKLSVGKLCTNCYILFNNTLKTCAVIDPGGDYDKINYIIKSYCATLTHIIITHSHSDHIDAVDELKNNHNNAKVVISETDNATLNNNNYTLSYLLGTTAPYTKGDILVRDNDNISICGYNAKIITTPGHTPGSICIYFKDENVLFSGDTLFYESVGRTDFPGGSYKSLSDSIKQKLFTLADNTKVYTGHNNETTILHEKESNFYI
jgi:glyoxylase-like metal-dependent hydrolase (beta-lactamase superfamily II)